MATNRSLSLRKRLLFTFACFSAFLAVVEGTLRLLPHLMHPPRDTMGGSATGATVVVVCAGDSVTFGLGLDVTHSYPWQLPDRLAARGDVDTRVVMQARPGDQSGKLEVVVIPDLQGLPLDQRPIVYAMYGHNDFFDWDPEATRGAFDGVVTSGDPRRGEPLRLLRLVRWFGNAAEGAIPGVNLEPGRVSLLASALLKTATYLRSRGGELYVLTYVVPPPPPPTVPAAAARVIRETHAGQIVINAKLRELAGGLKIEVVDLERRVDTGATWSSAWWIDNIHLSARGLDAVASVVDEHLRVNAPAAGSAPGTTGGSR